MRFPIFLLAVALIGAVPAFAAEITASSSDVHAGTVTVEPTQADMVPPHMAALPMMDGEITNGQYPILRLMPDKIEVIHLDTDAASVIVGNPAHLIAVTETPRQILLIPRRPGATQFQVLDKGGKTLMQRSVIVAAPEQNYVRVRRACAIAANGTCQEFSVFYCPDKDMCHEVIVSGNDKAANANVAVPTTSAGAGGSSSVEMIDDKMTPVPATTPPAGLDNAPVMP